MRFKSLKELKKMLFDIFNKTTGQEEKGLHSANPNMLKKLYEDCGDEIVITRAYPDIQQPQPVIVAPPLNIPLLPVSEEEIGLLPISPNIPVCPPQYQILPKTETKFYNDNGVDFKIENGELYKKTWTDVDMKNFRILNVDTNKEFKGKNQKIQILDWVKIG